MNRNIILEITAILQAFKVVYPHHFPKSDDDMKALILVWVADLGHIPIPVLKEAAKYLRGHEDFPTIAAMTRSIKAVAGIPTRSKIQKSLEWMAELTGNKNNSWVRPHPIVKMVWNALGGYQGVVGRNQTGYDIAFNLAYNEAVDEWFAEATKPENVAMLTRAPERISVGKAPGLPVHSGSDDEQ